jgi:peptidyl-prolyl cis-trans isomerase C
MIQHIERNLMKRVAIFAPLALATLFMNAPAVSAQGSTPAAKVNGMPIPQSRLDLATKSQLSQGGQDTPELRKAIRDALINNELVSQEAVKRGLDKQPNVAAQLDLDRQRILANAYFSDYFTKNPITDEALKKEYERMKSQTPPKEYKVRHILVDKEDDAKNIIAQIKKGGSFEKLAAEHSKDPGSKGRGGDLDWGPAERYVKPFADALRSLKKGGMTDAPVQTDFGFHVIRLEDERATKIPNFEDVKAQVQQSAQNQALQKHVQELRAKAKIE